MEEKGNSLVLVVIVLTSNLNQLIFFKNHILIKLTVFIKQT